MNTLEPIIPEAEAYAVAAGLVLYAISKTCGALGVRCMYHICGRSNDSSDGCTYNSLQHIGALFRVECCEEGASPSVAICEWMKDPAIDANDVSEPKRKVTPTTALVQQNAGIATVDQLHDVAFNIDKQGFEVGVVLKPKKTCNVLKSDVVHTSNAYKIFKVDNDGVVVEETVPIHEERH